MKQPIISYDTTLLYIPPFHRTRPQHGVGLTVLKVVNQSAVLLVATVCCCTVVTTKDLP